MARQYPHSSFNQPVAKPIAIVGMAGRFASAPDIAAFQRAIHTGESLLSPTPEGRFTWLLKPAGSMLSSAGGFLPDVASFDAEAFSIGRREALRMDPQLRMLLETTLGAMQDAGLKPRKLRGSRRTCPHGWRRRRADCAPRCDRRREGASARRACAPRRPQPGPW